MFPPLSAADLDTLDPAALKAILLAQQERHQAQHDEFKAQQERYTATLSSRATEIDRLTLLVEKLKHMLFGKSSEKVLCHIEQLEFQIEDFVVASAIEEAQAMAPQPRPAPARPFRRPLPDHLPRETTRTCQTIRRARTVADVSASWAKMLPRCWSTSGRALRFSAM